MGNMNVTDAAPVFGPADLAVAQTGGWVGLKGANGVTLTFHKGAGASGQAAVLTFRQATDNAGANAKDLATITTIYKKAAGATTWTKVTQAAGATYTADAVPAGLYSFDISASQLDVANGFCAVSVNVASVGAGPQFGGMVAEYYGQRYGGSLDSAIAPFAAEASSDPDEARAQQDKERARERALEEEGREKTHKAQEHARTGTPAGAPGLTTAPRPGDERTPPVYDRDRDRDRDRDVDLDLTRERERDRNRDADRERTGERDRDRDRDDDDRGPSKRNR